MQPGLIGADTQQWPAHVVRDGIGGACAQTAHQFALHRIAAWQIMLPCPYDARSIKGVAEHEKLALAHVRQPNRL